MAEYTRKDIHQTSTGVGHHYRPGYYFPSSNFKSVLREPLPSTLVNPDEVPTVERFKTTTGLVHDHKHIGGPYGNEEMVHTKAPAHWKVNYVKDLHEKLGAGGWRRPLTMGYQTTETHEQFRNQPAAREPEQFKLPEGYIMNHHQTDGPAKRVLPNTENDKLKGRPFFIKDQGILNLNDPYVTSTQKAHRAFKPKELNGYAKKDVPTYWQCEDYPKAWGHGLKHNPVPNDVIKQLEIPMRDRPMFKTETRIRRVPDKSVPVPHTGLKTVYTNSFLEPSDVKMKEIYYCPVNTPYELPKPGSKSAFSAPGMYNTEYQNVGSRKNIVV